MNTVSLSNHAERINNHHDAAQAAAQSAIEHALQAGQLLIEVKASLAHGELTAWINQHCVSNKCLIFVKKVIQLILLILNIVYVNHRGEP
ncbi:MAG: hypothetical protein KDJ99_34420 [Candidatus Competibacteraceae bacterium]|nr:hypothetical protein [Candidatus Competibacteraceae bacterium]